LPLERFLFQVWLRSALAKEGDPMPTGTVAFYNKARGFAFIRPDNGSGNVFVHISAFISAGLPLPTEGQKVSFDIELNPRDGKPGAVNIGQSPAPDQSGP
jgi:cold shock protein